MYNISTKKYDAAQLFSTLIINVSWAENQYIRMISEGSCDAEENSQQSLCITAIIYSLKYIQIENIILNCNNVSQYYCYYCIFDQITAALGSRRDFFQKHLKKNHTNPKLLKGAVHLFTFSWSQYLYIFS